MKHVHSGTNNPTWQAGLSRKLTAHTFGIDPKKGVTGGRSGFAVYLLAFLIVLPDFLLCFNDDLAIIVPRQRDAQPTGGACR